MAISFIQMTYNLVDILWIGRLGSRSVAAIGSIGCLMWMMNSVALISKVGAEISIRAVDWCTAARPRLPLCLHTTTLAMLIGLLIRNLFPAFPHPYVSFLPS